MRVLIIKTSSMGDVIHTLPALTDAGNALPGIQFDWVVEENFAEIPRWHPLVQQVIPVALRRWRKNLLASQTRQEWNQCRHQMQATTYDIIIDAQALLKSAWLGWIAKGEKVGLSWSSAREPFASLFYQRKVDVGKVKAVHAVTRMRRLLSAALNYDMPGGEPDYGISRRQFSNVGTGNYIVFLHGTTWTTKHWPEIYWIELAKKISAAGFSIKLPWGNEAEYARAQRIAAISSHIEILPKMKLAEIASVLAGAKAIVSVDTGLGHLAAALDVPTVSLYGPTDAGLTGAVGRSQYHLSASYSCSPCLSSECQLKKTSESIQPPCFSTVTPARVWEKLELIVERSVEIVSSPIPSNLLK